MTCVAVTIRKLIKTRELAAVRVGGQYRIPAAAYEMYKRGEAKATA